MVQTPCNDVMQAEARAHLDKRFSAFPDYMPVVTLSTLPGRPHQWLLTRCVKGQTPQMVQVEVISLSSYEDRRALSWHLTV